MTDLPVAASFESELAALLPGLPEVAQVVTSPLQRCRRLAERVGAARGLSVTVQDDLHEMDFGAWEMVSWDQVPRDQLDIWAKDFMGARPHGGESVQALENRVRGALDGVAKDALVVTHSGVIRAAAVLAGHPKGWTLDVAYGGWVALEV